MAMLMMHLPILPNLIFLVTSTYLDGHVHEDDPVVEGEGVGSAGQNHFGAGGRRHLVLLSVSCAIICHIYPKCCLAN